MNSQILFTAMAKQKAPDARLERNAADGLFAKPSYQAVEKRYEETGMQGSSERKSEAYMRVR